MEIHSSGIMKIATKHTSKHLQFIDFRSQIIPSNIKCITVQQQKAENKEKYQSRQRKKY